MLTTDTLKNLEQIARGAGDIILEIYSKPIHATKKADDSPVTGADILAESYILEQLKALFPHVPIVAEEATSSGKVPEIESADYFFLVDALDGTKEFINKNGEFTVNIGLIKGNEPVAGVVYAPAKDTLYSGLAGAGAWRSQGENHEPISTRVFDKSSLSAVGSRSHGSSVTQEFLSSFNVTEFKGVGSSLKFCLIAQGEADIYPRFGRTMEWDTAAGDAVLRAAGGMCLNPDGTPFVYAKRNQPDDSDFANGHFVAISDASAGQYFPPQKEN